jgi:exodeoxyribonuclease VII small subunit
MATNEAGEFEKALARLEEINGKLERENVGLDESVALFKEGKDLQRKCEALLKAAQGSIAAAADAQADGAPAPAAPSGQLPF